MVSSFTSPDVDLTADGDDLRDGEISILDALIDLTQDSENESEAIIVESDDDSTQQIPQRRPALRKSVRKQTVRNVPVSYPLEILDRWSQFGLRPGKTVELKGKDGKDGDFVRVQDIILNPTKSDDNIILRGQRLRRAKYIGGFTGTARVGGQTVGGKMKRDLNELALLFEVDKDDSRPPEEQSMVEALLSEVLCVRHVVFTHEDFPRRSFRESTILNRRDPNYELLKQSVKETGVLCCRYAYTEYYKDARERLSTKKCNEGSLMRIFLSDSDFPAASLTLDTAAPQPKCAGGYDGPVKKRTITYGSGCCGAGGDCLGARWGGATVKYGWDFDKSACQSFALNHPMAKIYRRAAVDFPRNGEDDHCDILHLSWPCDYFSPNHTSTGKNDDANISALFGTYEKLMSAKPRVHTQENTFGINSHHPEFFAILIQEIVRAGYNVRWKVDQFADHGSPASRKRLIIIASKIGIPLPEFPKTTHGPPGSGLARYRTVHNAIAKTPANASWHHGYESPYAFPKEPYSPHIAKSSCVTRDGGKHPHPSGLRPFTPREMASLQGFPESYQFNGRGLTEVKKQIGNAIPPNVWKYYIKSCVHTLEQFDAGLIDESGRPIKQGIPEPRPSSVYAKAAQSTNISTICLDRENGFATPSTHNHSSYGSNNTLLSFPSSSFSTSSSASKSAYLTSRSPATRHSCAWSEESRNLSPELSLLRTCPNGFKRKNEMVYLTNTGTKANNCWLIDLTMDD